MAHLAVPGQKTSLPGNSVYATNAWFIFGAFCFIYLFFNWYLQTQILTDQVYTYSLSGKVNPDKLTAFLDGQHRASFLSYVLIPVTMLVKMSLVTLCLLAGFLITSQKTSFATLFRIVLFAETAFIGGALLRLLLLAFSHPVNSLGQYISFAPLSLYSLFEPRSIPNWLTYPLQTLDVCQIGYVLLLAAGLRFYYGQSFKSALELVLGSYGLGLFCCMIGFAFISISFNP
jgi:hypothetical protein